MYLNAVAALKADGLDRDPTLRGMLSKAAHTSQDWNEFKTAVHAQGLTKTTSWVGRWDAQMTAQTAWRSTVPAHYSTGALDPKLAVVRRFLKDRRWTFRNLGRMNQLLGLMRLHLNRQDHVHAWAELIAKARTATPTMTKLDESAMYEPDGSRRYSLRKHPVAPRTRGAHR